MTVKTATSDALERLRDLAEWAGVMSHWLERLARHENDERDPLACTVRFPDARALDGFLTAFRQVGEELEAVAEEIDRKPKLRVVTGGRHR